MNNSINNTSFKANIKTLTKVKNKEAFNRVMEDFSKATQKYPNDTLYITRTPYGAYSWHLSKEKHGDFYNSQEIFTDSIDRHIEDMGTKKFAKELINAFKALILQDKISPKVLQLKSDLEKTKAIAQAYKRKGIACESTGKDLNAKRYFIIANRNKAKIEEISAEIAEKRNIFDKEIEKLSKEFKEIGQVEL